ncbi:MAG: glycosyltransferase [Bacteroidota bacterium]
MKILHIGQVIGGLDVYIRNIIAHSDDKVEFVIVKGDQDNSPPIVRNNIPIKEYKIRLYRSVNPFKDLTGLTQILKIIKKESPDAIHCHSAKGGFLGRIAGYLTRTKTFYTPHAFSFLADEPGLKQKTFLYLEKAVIFNSKLLACSNSELKLGIDVVGYEGKNALVWSNSVPDVSGFSQETAPVDGPYICYVGRPSFQKNSFFLLEVIKKTVVKHPNLRFYMIGVGFHSPDLDELEDAIKKNKLENHFILLPWLSQFETFRYVKHSLFYLTVSRYEGLPLSVLEALSLGKAIVASDVFGNVDCVDHGVNGYLLPLQVDVFAEKIGELVVDSVKLQMFEQNSRNKFLNEFHIDKQIGLLNDIYANNND